jgi:hypothetical protein
MFRKASPEFPKLLVFNEKHGDRRYLINSKEDALKAFREVFNQRLNEGYWYDDQDMIKINTYFQNAQKKVDAGTMPADNIEYAVLQTFMKYRSSGEYENFEFIDFDVPEETKPLENPKVGRDIITL